MTTQSPEIAESTQKALEIFAYNVVVPDVFNELGSGHAEAVYQKAMEVGLRLEKIPYENQRIVPIFYKKYNVGQGIPDIIINEGNNGKI